MNDPRPWESGAVPSTALPAQKRLQRARELYADGTVFFRAGQYTEAMERWLAAIEHNPTDADVLSSLGMLLMMVGRLDDAAKMLYEALQYQPKHFDAAFNLGQIYFAQGNLQDAVEMFLQARESDPAQTSTHIAIAKVLLASGHLDDAEGAAQFAFAQEDSQQPAKPVAEVRLVLAKIAYARGDDAKAYEWALAESEKFPNDAGAFALMARILGEKGDLLHAQQLLQIAQERAPHDEEIADLLQQIQTLLKNA